MALTPIQRQLQRKSALWADRTSWLAHWQEISENTMPRTGRFLDTQQNNGNKRHNKILDSTGTRALRVLAAGMMAGMTSPARPWFRLATPDKALMEYAPVKRWLAEVTDRMRVVFNRSNTYRALHSIYEELGGYGTAASVILDDFDDVIAHYPMTIGEYAIATNYKGEVDTLYREFKLSVAQLVQQFGLDNVSPAVKNLYDTHNLDALRPVIHVIEPRTARDYASKTARNMPWASCYIEAGVDDRYLRESGFRHFPALAPRWHATGGDVYGNSPGMEALGDIKQLQHAQLRKGQTLDYKLKPPLQVPQNTAAVNVLPGGVTVVDSSGGAGIKTLFSVDLDMNALLEDVRDVRQRINETFYVDLFLMLAQQDTRQPITAREVAERHEEKLLMLGPVLERLHNELLKKKIDITFDNMVLAGLIPPPPPELDKMELNVEFVSVLAQAQRAIGVTGVDRLLQTIGTIATFQANVGRAPDALDKLDTDQVIDEYSDMLGVDPSLIVADDKVAIIRQDRAQREAAAQQAAAAPVAAQTAKTMSQTDTKNQNGLTDLINSFSGYSIPG